MTLATGSVQRSSYSRPLWRRLAGHLRDLFYRSASLVDQVSHRSDSGLMPPLHLRVYYYRTTNRAAFTRAAEGAAAELRSRGLRPEHRILDIGSGIGNLAVGVLDYVRGGYDGLEIHPDAVAWCQRAITREHPTFRFHRADLFSQAYNPTGSMRAANYRFPFDDRSFDVVFLGSVFTHLLPDAAENYLREIARVLVPGGICVASCFLLNQDSRTGIDAGQSFMSFPVQQNGDLCRLHDESVPEAAVALDEAFMRRVLTESGLEVRDIRRGGWWSGSADDQDVLTAAKR